MRTFVRVIILILCMLLLIPLIFDGIYLVINSFETELPASVCFIGLVFSIWFISEFGGWIIKLLPKAPDEDTKITL